MISIVFVLLVISGIILIGLGLYSARFPTVAARPPFAWMAYLVAAWCLLFAINGLVEQAEVKLLLFQVVLGIVALVPVSCLITTMYLVGLQGLVTRRSLIALLIFPAISIVLNATNGLTSWFITGYHPITTMGYSTLALDYGPGFVLHTGYSYIIILITFLLLLWHILRTSLLYRWRDILVLVGFVVPFVGNAVVVSGSSSGFDFTPILFVITGVSLTFALFRFQLLSIMPVARSIIMDISSDPILVLDNEGRLVDVNPAASVLFDLQARDVGKEARALFAQREGMSGLLDGTRGDRTAVLRTVSGERHYDRQVDEMMDGEVAMGSVIILRDVTDSRLAQDALRESEERYRAIFEQFNGTILVVDLHDGSVLQANHAFCSFVGLDQEEVLKLNVRSLPTIDRSFEDRMMSEVTRGRRFTTEIAPVRPGGSVVNVEIMASPFRYGGREAICIMGWDITERRQAEANRERMEKLEATGTLAGGIAHDFNNLLTSVLGYVSLTKMRSEPGSETYRGLEEAEMTVLQAKEVAQELLSLAKGGAPICKPVSVPELLKVTSNHPFLNSSVQCHLHVPPGAWMAQVDQGQIGRVFTNLFINAREAMPDGGTVDVTVSGRAVGPGDVLGLRPGDYVVVEVRDSGAGIPPDVLPHIFEPYYTTKRQGFGLGLSVVHATLARHQGGIEVESRVGEGTTFRIYLPAAEGAASVAVGQRPTIERGEGRVLIMDDEEYVLDVAAEMVRALGYDVGISHDGLEALEEYRRGMEKGQRYDVVIMDLTNPGGMGGKEAVVLLQQLDPQVRAIVSSGYSTDPVMANFSDHGFVGVLPKPYKLEELSAAIRQGMNATKGEAGSGDAAGAVRT